MKNCSSKKLRQHSTIRMTLLQSFSRGKLRQARALPLPGLHRCSQGPGRLRYSTNQDVMIAQMHLRLRLTTCGLKGRLGSRLFLSGMGWSMPMTTLHCTGNFGRVDNACSSSEAHISVVQAKHNTSLPLPSNSTKKRLTLIRLG